MAAVFCLKDWHSDCWTVRASTTSVSRNINSFGLSSIKQIHDTDCWRKRMERETSYLNVVVYNSLGASVPWYVSTQLTSGPVEWLGQYLRGTCLHHSSAQYSSESEQLLVSLFGSYGCYRIASLHVRVFMWSLRIIVQNILWIKVMQILTRCITEILRIQLHVFWRLLLIQ